MDKPVDMVKYVKEFLDFLNHYEWVYNFKAIEVFMHGNIQKMPPKFQEAFKLMNEKDFQHILEHQLQESWYSELKDFVMRCLLLKCTEACSESSEHPYDCDNSEHRLTSSKIPEKWSKKKYAEVSSLSEFVGSNYRNFNCDKAVDIGAGLGYLSLKLSESIGASVVAIEGQRSRVISAEKLLAGKREQMPLDVKFVNMNLSHDIVNQVSPLVLPCSRVCLTGLHACGELSNMALKLFISDRKYVCLNVVPCCYHKMDLISYDNFPLSRSFREIFAEDIVKNKRLLGYQFCRLASQRCGSEFLRNILTETKQLVFRSVLEYYVNREGFQLSKTKRKAQNCEAKDFTEYVTNNIGDKGAFKIICDRDIELIQHYRNLETVYDEMKIWWKPITGILALQGALQILAEQFILLDKVQFLLETPAVTTVKLKRIISESVSPRGIVVYAVKKQVG